MGADGGPRRGRRAARARGLRARPPRAGARRRDDLRRPDADPAPARGRAAGLRRRRSSATSSANPALVRLARDPADGAPAGREHAGGRGRSSASSPRDEFAAIPRDMFWFTAIALLGETCALIGDTEQAPVLYRLLEPHREQAGPGHPGREPRLHAPLPRAAERRAAATSTRPSATSRPALEINAACGLRPVVALMRREYAEMLIARAATATASAPARCCGRRCARPRRAGCRS